MFEDVNDDRVRSELSLAIMVLVTFWRALARRADELLGPGGTKKISILTYARADFDCSALTSFHHRHLVPLASKQVAFVAPYF